jgi:hypothetical protein
MKGQDEITNDEDTIDSRDVIARIKYLADDRDSFTSECASCDGTGEAITEGKHGEDKNVDCPSCDGAGSVDDPDEWIDANPDEAEELAALEALAKEAEGYCSDWDSGAQLIRDSYFEDYAQELADDIGAIDSDAKWPLNCIDWTQAARELQQDYTSVEFGDVTYWVR